MRRFKTIFYNYTSGVEFTMSWANEQEYLEGKGFLDALTGGSIGRHKLDQPDFYILETREQFDAMLEFRRKLREKRSG